MELDNPSASKRPRKERKLSERSVKVSQVTEMSEIWEHLPEDVLEIVLTWLPIAILFRFRLVCQRWNSFLTSPNFRKRCEELAMQKQPWFFAKDGGVGPGSLYDPCTKKWRNTPFIPLSTSDTFPMTFDGGLVCFLNIRHTSFNVGNPLTQHWRAVPCSNSAVIKMEARGHIAIGMITVPEKYSDKCRWRCKIVLLDNQGNFEVYTTMKDVESPSPMTTGKLPSNIEMPSHLSPTAVTIGTRIVFLGSKPHGVVMYNLEDKVWAQILIPPPPNSSDLALIECMGRLFLTGVVKDRNTNTFSVRVWKFQTRFMRAWKEIDRMPSSFCAEFIGKAGAFYECLCNKNVVVISLRTSRMNRIFTYDVVSREWTRVPRIVLPRQTRLTILSGVGFFPCFTSP